MRIALHRFLRDETGVTAVEYGLIAALVGVAVIIGAIMLGGQLNDAFVYISGKMSSAFDGN